MNLKKKSLFLQVLPVTAGADFVNEHWNDKHYEEFYLFILTGNTSILHEEKNKEKFQILKVLYITFNKFFLKKNSFEYSNRIL